METTAIIMMILLLAMMWGGLIYTIGLAIKQEKDK